MAWPRPCNVPQMIFSRPVTPREMGRESFYLCFRAHQNAHENMAFFRTAPATRSPPSPSRIARSDTLQCFLSNRVAT